MEWTGTQSLSTLFEQSKSIYGFTHIQAQTLLFLCPSIHMLALMDQRQLGVQYIAQGCFDKQTRVNNHFAALTPEQQVLQTSSEEWQCFFL